MALKFPTHPVVRYSAQLCIPKLQAVVFCRPTAFYYVNECVSVSVTISFGVKGTIQLSFAFLQCIKDWSIFSCSA